MKRWKRLLFIKGEDPQEAVEDEYRISDGCCFFHDQSELDEFENVDDDGPK